jgi:hypothetical protein
MVNDSTNQLPLRVERIDEIGFPDTIGFGTPSNVVNVKIGHGSADDFSSFVVDGIVHQTQIEI